MSKMSVADARRNFSEVVSRVAFGRERIVLTRRSKATAVMVAPEDAELLELVETLTDIETAKARLASARERPIPWAEAKRALAR